MQLSHLPALCLSHLYSFYDRHGLATLRRVSKNLHAASRYPTAWSTNWEQRFSILQPTKEESEEAIASRQAEKEHKANSNEPFVPTNPRSVESIDVLASSQRAFLLQYARAGLSKFLTIGQYTYPMTYTEKEVPSTLLRDDEKLLSTTEQALYQSVYDRVHSRLLTNSPSAADDRKRSLMKELMEGSTHWWSPLILFTNVERLEFDSDLVSGHVMQMIADFMPQIRHLELRTHIDGRTAHIELNGSRFFTALGRMDRLEFLRIPNAFLQKWNQTNEDRVGALQYLSRTPMALSLRHICFSAVSNDNHTFKRGVVEAPSSLFLDDLFWLGKYPSLTQLDLSESGAIGDALFARLLAAIPSLQRMDLRCSSSVTDSVLAAVVALPDLNFLDLTCCYSLSGASINFIARCASLTKLVLSSVNFNGDTLALAGLSSLHQLTSLDVSGAKMNSGVLTSGAWDRLTQLRQLHVQFSQLSQTALERLCQVIHTSIEELKLKVDENEKDPVIESSTDDAVVSLACLSQCESLTDLTLGWGSYWSDKKSTLNLSVSVLRTFFIHTPPRLLVLQMVNKFDWSRDLSEQLVSARSRIGRLVFTVYGSCGPLLTSADFLPLVDMSTLVEIEFQGGSDPFINIARKVSNAQAALSNSHGRFCRVIVPKKNSWD